MHKDKKQAYFKAPWDERGSTFCQLIRFTNGKSIQGYSKRVGFNERNNKIDLLTDWILRNLVGGYLDQKNPSKSEIDCIEFYRNEIDGSAKLILRLHYTHYEIDKNNFEDPSKLLKFLRRFYERVNAGHHAMEIYNELKIRVKQRSENLLSLERHIFQDPIQLLHHCQKIIKTRKHQPSEVRDFFGQYMSRFFGEQYKDADFKGWINTANQKLSDNGDIQS